MVRIYKSIMVVLMVLAPWSSTLAQDPGVRHFQDIAARLDIGGDLFLVMHAGRWLEAVLTRLEGGEDSIPPASAEERDLREASGQLRRFASRQGISGLQGIGISSVPLQGGMSNLKIFLLRDAQDANLPFWRGLFGWQPRRLLSLDFLPPDMEFVWASTPDFEGLWQLLESARSELQQEGLDRMMQQLTATSEKLVEKEPLLFLRSLRDEILVSARARPVEAGSTSVSWEWLVVVGTGEPVMFHAVQHAFERAGRTLQDVMIGGHTMHRVQLPAEAEEGTVPYAFASVPGFFLIGNSARMIEDALRSQRHRSGLLARPEFIDAYRGQNMVNNGILYVSKQGAETLRHLHNARVLASVPATLDPFSQQLLEELAGGSLRGSVCALTLANWRQGIMIAGRSGIGGTAMGSWLGSFPAGWWYRLPGLVERLLPE